MLRSFLNAYITFQYAGNVLLSRFNTNIGIFFVISPIFHHFK